MKKKFLSSLYLFNVKIPTSKKIPYSLPKIEGLGISFSKTLCFRLGLSLETKSGYLKETQINRLRNYIYKNCIIRTELQQEQENSIKRLVEISSYRGLRHSTGLPLRGQRTHTNAKTQRKLSFKRYKVRSHAIK